MGPVGFWLGVFLAGLNLERRLWHLVRLGDLGGFNVIFHGCGVVRCGASQILGC